MVDLKDVFGHAVDLNGAEVEVALVVAIDKNGKANIELAGVDKLMIGRNAVMLTAAVKDILETKLFTASQILQTLDEHGRVHIARGDGIMQTVDEIKPKQDEESTDDDNSRCIADIKEGLTMLANFICEAIKDK